MISKLIEQTDRDDGIVDKVEYNLDYIQQILDEAETEEHLFFNKQLVTAYRLSNGYCLLGKSDSIQGSGFMIERAREECYQDALIKLKDHECYVVHDLHGMF